MKILVKRNGALGDVIEVTAITERLRQENPDAIIDVETAYSSVFANNPAINHAHVSRETYDSVIDLNGAFERVLRKLHPIDAYSEVAFHDRKTPHRLVFNWNAAPLPPLINSLLSFDRPVVVLHPARSWPIRTLPREWWQELVQKLSKRGYTVVVTGTGQDWALTDVTDLRGMLSLAGQAALIDAVRCFVCSESGPMILAQTTKTPVIALLTMVPPEHVAHEREAPFVPVRSSVPCVGCATEQPAETTFFDCLYGHRNCVTAFDAEAVAGVVDRQAAR